MNSVVDYLKFNADNNPDKIIFLEDENNKITYKDFYKSTKVVATNIINKKNLYNKPIAVFIDRSIDCLKGMFGVLTSGNFYCVLDVKSPVNRLNSIIETLKPEMIIANNKSIETLKGYNFGIDILNIDEMDSKSDEELIEDVHNNFVSSSPAYVLFTSGSTGVPKGSVINHTSLVTYVNWFISAFDINENTIFGNQTPFYFSMSVSDIFSTVMTGATFCIVPKICFSFPVKLMAYLNDNKINTIYWVPSALSIVANLKTFDYVKPEYLEKVLFAGEVMTMPQLNIWRKHLPNIMYANLFGPTETTDICTYYVVNRDFDNAETLPIGKACENSEILLVNEKGEACKEDEMGEMYVRGTIVGNGYYNNPEKTKEAFVQNPLQNAFPEIVYKTGDLAKYNKYGELEYFGRKDFQIKHMGYRIELGEIETNINALEGLTICACIYDTDSSQIVLYFESTKLKEEDVIEFANKKLVSYMRPNKVIKLTKMPYNANGKIDRVKLKNDFKEMEK